MDNIPIAQGGHQSGGQVVIHQEAQGRSGNIRKLTLPQSLRCTPQCFPDVFLLKFRMLKHDLCRGQTRGDKTDNGGHRHSEPPDAGHTPHLVSIDRDPFECQGAPHGEVKTSGTLDANEDGCPLMVDTIRTPVEVPAHDQQIPSMDEQGPTHRGGYVEIIIGNWSDFARNSTRHLGQAVSGAPSNSLNRVSMTLPRPPGGIGQAASILQ